MTLYRVGAEPPRQNVESKSGSDKWTCADHVGDTVSTPQLEGHVSYREDTLKRTPDNR